MEATVPEAYRRWQRHAVELLRPLEALMLEGRSETWLKGPPSDHGSDADRLEAFVRPCLLAAFYARSVSAAPSPEGVERCARLARWFRAALVEGTHPASPQYWGPNANYHQHGVETGLLAIALEVARSWFWEPLSAEEKARVTRWMASNRGTGHHWNNHYFHGIFSLEFLQTAGDARAADRASIDFWLGEMETMYRGQGWFMDGVNQSFDHYNAYAFHFYAPFWIYLYGDRAPERCGQWRAWTRAFVRSYQHSFAASGEHPAFGRSITYRFNASAPFAAGYLVDANPLPPGRSRRLCTRNLEFFLEQPITQEQGILALGWTDPFAELAEPYSCAGSVYWCAKVFSAFLLPPDHPFWTDPEEPLPSEKGDFVHTVKPAGLVFRSVDGEVEILNAGSAICVSNRDKFGPYKWGKVAYRSGFGFSLGTRDHYSKDLGLTARDPRDGRVFGRHTTLPIELTDTYYVSSYNLGDRELQCNLSVETLVAWNGPWILQVHRYVSYQPVDLCVGGYSLPMRKAAPPTEVRDGHGMTLSSGGRTVALEVLNGSGTIAVDGRLDETTPRRHLQAPFHATPVFSAKAAAAETGVLAVLCLASPSAEFDRWKADTLDAGSWRLVNEQRQSWTLTHPMLPALSTP